jgi:hypothetical protein
MLVFAIAAVWFMIIIGFKVAGPKKVGFLAGKLEHPEYDATAPARDVGALTLIEDDPPEEASSDIGTDENLRLLESDLASPLIITNTIDADSDGARADEKFKKKVIAVRVTFVLSGLAMIVCGSLFYGYGMMSFRRSLDHTSRGLQVRPFNIGFETGLNKAPYLMLTFTSTMPLLSRSSSMTLHTKQKLYWKM